MEESNPLPGKFRFYEEGEEYVLGTQSAKCAGRTVDSFTAHHPSLYRRYATVVERGVLETARLSYGSSLITLFRGDEIYSLLKQNDSDEQLRGVPRPTSRTIRDESRPYRLVRSAHGEIVPLAPGSRPSQTRPRNRFAGCYRVPHGMGTRGTDQPVQLAPIRLEIDHEGLKLKDAFLWNMSDTSVKPAHLAECIVQDLELPAGFARVIAERIEGQLEAFEALMAVPCPNRTASIKLELQIGRELYVDQFLWEHNNPLNSPEAFAETTCAELGLSGEFVPSIAISIREQLLLDRKLALYAQSDRMETVASKQQDTGRVFRAEGDMDSWAPALYPLTVAEVEKREQDEERESRRRRRATRGGPEDTPASLLKKSKAAKRRSMRRYASSLAGGSPLASPRRGGSAGNPELSPSKAAQRRARQQHQGPPPPPTPSDAVLAFLREAGMETASLVDQRLVVSSEPAGPLAPSHVGSARPMTAPVVAAPSVGAGGHQVGSAGPPTPAAVARHAAASPATSAAASAPGTPGTPAVPGMSPGMGRSRRSDGRYAFTENVLATLKSFLRRRMLERPHEGVAMPSDTEKLELAAKTHLTLKQISQWFQNRRKDYMGTSRGRNGGGRPCLERYLNS